MGALLLDFCWASYIFAVPYLSRAASFRSTVNDTPLPYNYPFAAIRLGLRLVKWIRILYI